MRVSGRLEAPAPTWIAWRHPRYHPGTEGTAHDMPDYEPDNIDGIDNADELSIGAENEGVLDASDTLDGDPGDDPLDAGIIPPDRWSAGEGYGSTLSEEEAGESLDQLLAEEEPDINPYTEARKEEEAAEEDEDGDFEDELLAEGDVPAPRAGRLVAEDEGAHPDEEPDLVARDVGIDAGAAGAEEAAVHVSGEEDDTRPGG